MKDNIVIGFDISPLVKQLMSKRGIGQSTLRLVKEFNSNSKLFNAIYYTTEKEVVDTLISGIEIHNVPTSNELPIILKRDNIDVFHINDYFDPIYYPLDFFTGEYKSLKTVISVYDVFPLYYPQRRLKSAERILTNLIPILHHVDKIRANSIDTKEELIRVTGISPAKVQVVYNGIEHNHFNTSYSVTEVNEIRNIYGFQREFILMVGAMDWRKNQITLLKAYKRLLKKERCPLDLVFVGAPKKSYLSFLQENSLEGRVKFLGLIPDEHLPLIYNAATVFAYPSLHEGFGNPPLEAMACGLPVISSDKGSLKEILGDASYYIDPLNEKELARAIWEVYSNSSLRNILISKGLNNVQRFTWQKSASELAKLYLDLVLQQD